MLVQTLVTLINLGARRLGLAGEPEEKDLEQARLAIEGARALQGLVPQEGLQQVRDALAQLQMAYVREAGGQPSEPAAGSPQPAEEAPKEPAEDAEERAKARSKIWTPPGS